MAGIHRPPNLGQRQTIHIQLHRPIPYIRLHLVAGKPGFRAANVKVGAVNRSDPYLIGRQMADIPQQKSPRRQRLPARIDQFGIAAKHRPGPGANLAHRQRGEMSPIPRPLSHRANIRRSRTQVETADMVINIAPVQPLRDFVRQMDVHRQIGHHRHPFARRSKECPILAPRNALV